jgi:ubiquitin carboxyl-terminal hydrolase 7
VHFKPRQKAKNDGEEFSLIMNKKWNYNHVALRVGEHLHTDPMKIRFFAPNPYSDLPKSPIRRSTVLTLNDMLQSTYYGPLSDTLFFEKLDVSIVEMENLRPIKVIYLNLKAYEEEPIELLLPKTATISDVIRVMKEKLMLDEAHSGQFRLFEVYNSKVLKVYDPEDPISIITDYGNVYGEEIPNDELSMLKPDRIVTTIHFYKDPFRSHGIPFFFVLKAKEPFSTTKHRLRQRLGIPEKEFDKYGITVIHDGKSRPIDDTEILLETLSNEDMLGLDHLERRRTDRSSSFERAIVIKN